MRIHITDQQSFNEAVRSAANTIKNGGVILYPTDTVYGLGVDGTSTDALKKIVEIKKTDLNKKLLHIVPHLKLAEQYVVVTSQARKLATVLLPGQLSLICKTLPNTPFSASKTLGIRIPNHPFCLQLAEQCDVPYTSTSANETGFSTGRSIDEILNQLDDRASMIDLIIDQGTLPESQPSTIVDVTGDKPIVIRYGAISEDELNQVLA